MTMLPINYCYWYLTRNDTSSNKFKVHFISDDPDMVKGNIPAVFRQLLQTVPYDGLLSLELDDFADDGTGTLDGYYFLTFNVTPVDAKSCELFLTVLHQVVAGYRMIRKAYTEDVQAWINKLEVVNR